MITSKVQNLIQLSKIADNIYSPSIENVKAAHQRLEKVIVSTPLSLNYNLSEKHSAKIYLKREDLQVVRSYKIRGAYNRMSSTPLNDMKNGIVCASAGNHAQGVALSCFLLGVKGTIFMPAPTPKQKLQQVKMFGKDKVEVVLVGDTFDDSYEAARVFGIENDAPFIHPFNDEKVIEGQATIGLEILDDANFKIDYLFLPIGGGGLSSGVSSIFKTLSPNTKIIGVEPAGAPAMYKSFEAGKVVHLDSIDKFVDGAAVKEVGALAFAICQQNLEEIALVDEGKICQTLIQMYNENGIVLEPAGALTLAVLDQYTEQIKGKNVVCLLSGSNNDITRTEEIRERSLLYEGLKHYFVIRFPQRAGALKEFVADILGPTDDIVHFEYSKKTSRERGPAIVGIELKDSKDLQPLVNRMKECNFFGEYINENPDLFAHLI